MPTLKQSERTFVPAPAGAHIARCVGMISLGTQPPGNPKFKPSFQVLLIFELPDEPIEMQGERRAMTISKFLNAYLGSPKKPSQTAQFLTAWRGKEFTPAELQGFDLSRVVGAACLLNVIHEEKDAGPVAKVASISPLPKGTVCPAQVNPKVVFEIEHGRNEVFNNLPEWLQKKIEACEEWQHPVSQASAEPEPDPEDAEDGSVPF